MTLINAILPMISILVSVALYTILERKILSYIQIRKGPNSVGLIGILQPFSDALKLFNKNLVPLDSMNISIAYFSPPISLFLSLTIISILPFMDTPSFDNKHNILMFFIVSSLSVYMILMIGWASNSKYAHMGVVRSIAQTISYEVSFFLIILFISLLSNSYYFTQISETQNMLWFMFGNAPLLILWLLSCMAEVNRSPFDFAEGESELVSGFNVEYMGGWFALIFLAEYTNMIILAILSTILFFKIMLSPPSMIALIFIATLMLWIRGSYPRFRYDLLMHLSWKLMLPTILFMLPFSAMISIYSI